jgi:prepilin-type N-terminal cleavage/methylation domain-containing protein
MRRSTTPTSESGFTIIELMIATSVLAVIILLVTVMITSIGNLYYKGVTQSQTQDTTRNIADQLSQDIELADSVPVVVTDTHIVPGKTLYALCVGTSRYSYVIGEVLGTNGFQHIVWRDKPSSPGCTPANLTMTDPPGGTNGSELMGAKSQLSALVVNTPSGSSLSTITVGVVYGASDLHTGSGTNTTCNGKVGDQFCASDALTVSAIQRVKGN